MNRGISQVESLDIQSSEIIAKRQRRQQLAAGFEDAQTATEVQRKDARKVAPVCRRMEAPEGWDSLLADAQMMWKFPPGSPAREHLYVAYVTGARELTGVTRNRVSLYDAPAFQR